MKEPQVFILYKGGYKYQLVEDYTHHLNIQLTTFIKDDFLCLMHDGTLQIKKGYAWDGPSGPTFDTRNFMRGSMVHDALYQLMRSGKLGAEYREEADKELRRLCIEDGMSKVRAWWVYKAVRWAARSAAMPSERKKILMAPQVKQALKKIWRKRL